MSRLGGDRGRRRGGGVRVLAAAHGTPGRPPSSRHGTGLLRADRRRARRPATGRAVAEEASADVAQVRHGAEPPAPGVPARARSHRKSGGGEPRPARDARPPVVGRGDRRCAALERALDGRRYAARQHRDDGRAHRRPAVHSDRPRDRARRAGPRGQEEKRGSRVHDAAGELHGRRVPADGRVVRVSRVAARVPRRRDGRPLAVQALRGRSRPRGPVGVRPHLHGRSARPRSVGPVPRRRRPDAELRGPVRFHPQPHGTLGVAGRRGSRGADIGRVRHPRLSKFVSRRRFPGVVRGERSHVLFDHLLFGNLKSFLVCFLCRCSYRYRCIP